MTDADAIVIGAGHNGLAAAIYLAKAGWKVLVIDKATLPGGAAKSAEITLPGFKHDLYATNIGLFLGSALYRDFGKELHAEGFEIVSSSHPFVSLFPDGDYIGMHQDGNQTVQEFERHSSHDAQAWLDLLAYFKKTSDYLLPLLQTEMPSTQALKLLWKMYRGLGKQASLELIQMLMKSSRQFVDAWFESEKVKALFVPWGMHLDFGPDVPGGATFPFLEPPIDHLNGMAFTKGGISNLIDAMVRVIEKNGGQVLLGQNVSQILVKGGRAVGIKTLSGKEYYAQKAVIANLTPTQLFLNLMPKSVVPSAVLEKASKFRYGPGTMMIHLALSKPVEWKSGQSINKYAYVHIGPYLEDFARTYQQAIDGYLPASPMLVIAQHTPNDTTRAPSGKHTLWIQVRALPAKPHKDALGILTAENWENIKEQYADRVIDKLAIYAPSIRESILKRTVLSPDDLQRDNPNLVGGDSVAGSHHLDQFYLFRPMPGWSRYQSPLPGLYMTGASTWPGGGLNATSGALVAQKILKRR